MAAVFLLLASGCLSPSGPDASSDGWKLVCDGDVAEPGWLQPCVMRTMTSPGSKAETWIAIDPTDASNVFVGTKDLDPALSADCVWTGNALTQDAGRTWTEVHIAGTYGERAPGSPWYGWACATDPMFAFDREGALHAVVEMYGVAASIPSTFSAGTHIVLATSPDAGRTWPIVRPLIQGDGYALSPDFPRIVANPRSGSLHASFLDLFTSQNCYVVNVRDGAPTPPVIVRAPADAFACVNVAASPAGIVTIAATGPTRGLTQPEESIPGSAYRFARSTDDGRSFSAWNEGFGFERAPSAVPEVEHHLGDNFECAYDLSGAATRGTLYCVYVDFADGHADVMLRASVDDGATWSAPRRVNGEGSRHQFMPNLAIPDDGSIHVVYLDAGTEADPALLHVLYASSMDGGVTWAQERITHEPSEGGRGRHQDGHPWYGDYIGASAVGNDVWFSFPDVSATNEPTLAAAHVVRT